MTGTRRPRSSRPGTRAHSPQYERLSPPRPFGPDWREILFTKINSANCEDCRRVLFDMLIRFSDFRDQVGVQEKMITKAMTEDDLVAIVRIFSRWIEDFLRGADFIFTRTADLPAMVIYREPLALLQHLFITLEHGDSNVFTRLRQRKKSDRRYAWYVKFVQRQAALAYSVLMELKAGSNEAVACINDAIIRYKRDLTFEVRFATLSNQILRREARHLGENEIQLALAEVRGKFTTDGALPNKGSARSERITSVARYLLSGCLDVLQWGGALYQPDD